MIFSSIVLPLDGSATGARGLACATWLAARLGARLHVLSATSRVLPAADELRRLHVPEARWPVVELHQAPAYPADAILAAIDAHRAGLVVMSTRGAASETRGAGRRATLVGHVTQEVMERSRVPVLLLPEGSEGGLPWKRLVVPVSGGPESDRAVALSVRLAEALDLSVQVAHVAGEGGREAEPHGAPAQYFDQLHHECAGQLEELVTRAVTTVSTAQRGCIQGLSLRRGQVVAELLDQVKPEGSVLAIGWNGQLGSGRAGILKPLLRALAVPLLLVKAERRAQFHLKVGEELGR